jgi:hypothetical protein
MGLCSWCRLQYQGPGIYHVCKDGTHFAQRMVKTSQEKFEEYARQDRCAAAERIMAKDRKIQNLPIQPNVKWDDFLWNEDDIKLAAEMGIKLC